MSTLIIEQLIDSYVFVQPIKVSRDVSIKFIRPWILIHGVIATGQLQCQVKQGSTVLATKTIDYTELNGAASEDYAHGYIRFDFDNLILHRAEGEADTDYVFEFSMINHVTDTSNYVGIVREWETKSAIVYGDVDGNGDALNSTIEPVGYQIYEYRS